LKQERSAILQDLPIPIINAKNVLQIVNLGLTNQIAPLVQELPIVQEIPDITISIATMVLAKLNLLKIATITMVVITDITGIITVQEEAVLIQKPVLKHVAINIMAIPMPIVQVELVIPLQTNHRLPLSLAILLNVQEEILQTA